MPSQATQALRNFVRVPAMERGDVDLFFEDQLANSIAIMKPRFQKVQIHYCIDGQCGYQTVDAEFDYKKLLKLLGQGAPIETRIMAMSKASMQRAGRIWS